MEEREKNMYEIYAVVKLSYSFKTVKLDLPNKTFMQWPAIWLKRVKIIHSSEIKEQSYY